MTKAMSNSESLLAAIKRKAPKPAEVKAVVQNDSPTAKKADGRIHIWLTDDDRKLVRELAAWLAGQGEKTSDSLILRTALRMAAPGGSLLEAYRKSKKQDGRFKRK